MTHDNVRVERDGHIVTVTIDRDGKMNACTPDMWSAIREAFDDISRSDARVVVITGANGDRFRTTYQPGVGVLQPATSATSNDAPPNQPRTPGSPG